MSLIGSSKTKRLYITGASVGNGADTTEDTLQSFTLPAGLLANVGDSVRIFAGGTFAASTDTKRVRLKIGGQVVNGFHQGTTTGAIAWALDCSIVKTGSSTQAYVSLGSVQSTAGQDGTAVGTLSLTDTSTIVVSITGQNQSTSTANSITCQLISVDYIRAS